MSRNSGKSRNQRGNQIQRFQRRDPFEDMHRMMMKGFGGFQHDQFFSRDLMKPFGDPFEDMLKFSDVHKGIHDRGKQGSFVCQTFVSSSKVGSDGKIHREDYFQNNMGEHKGGHTISQKHQAYKNNKGVNRIAEERMLNEKGRKIVRQKRGNQIQQTNHYYNMDEEEGDMFMNDWRSKNQQLKFLDRHQKYLSGSQPRKQQLTYEQPRSRNQINFKYK